MAMVFSQLVTVVIVTQLPSPAKKGITVLSVRVRLQRRHRYRHPSVKARPHRLKDNLMRKRPLMGATYTRPGVLRFWLL